MRDIDRVWNKVTERFPVLKKSNSSVILSKTILYELLLMACKEGEIGETEDKKKPAENQKLLNL